MGGEFGGEWTHVYVWLNPFAVLMKLSQHCQLALLQHKIKSLKKKPSITGLQQPLHFITHTHTHTHTHTELTCEHVLQQSLEFWIWKLRHTVQFSRLVVSDSPIPWAAARQASLSITNSQSLPKLMSIESVTPSNHLILCCPLLLLPSIFSNIRVFSKESVLRIR